MRKYKVFRCDYNRGYLYQLWIELGNIYKQTVSSMELEDWYYKKLSKSPFSLHRTLKHSMSVK